MDELIDKFVKEWHLSVPEQRTLPPSGLPGNRIVARISAILQSDGHYPFDWQPSDAFDGGLIVRGNSDFTLYWKAEVGVGRYELTETETTDDPGVAARSWARRFLGDEFDGIKINWKD